MESLFAPYFLVYRYKDESFDHSFHCQSFDSLCKLYAFIGKYFECWDYYKVGYCLESFTI